MGFKNRYTAMFMIICIVLSMFSGVAFAAPGDDPVQEVPGALILSKLPTTHVTGSDEWVITLSLNGLDKITTTDVVLVLDSSGSMADNQNGNARRLTNTKAAAKGFVDQLIKPGDANTRIAVVTFNGSATTQAPFSNDSSTLNAAIDGAGANGGTHIQSGIRQAHDLLNNSSAHNKYIVLLGDGDPTYSYQVTSVTGGSVSLDSCTVTTSGSGSNIRYSYSNPVFSYDLSTMTLTFSNTMVGSGSAYNISSGNVVYRHTNANNSNTHDHVFPHNNGIPTIYEANQAKADGIKFYSVGLGLDPSSAGRQVLLDCSNGNEYFFPMNDYDPAGLESAFREIANNIAFAATQVVINDPMGSMFTLDEASISVMKNGTVDPNPDFTVVMDGGVQKIIWNLASVENASSPITMSYTIKINQAVDPRENFETNGDTTIEYIDVDGNVVRKEFYVPVVNSGDFGIVTVNCYLVDDDGYPLNPQGGRALTREDIAILHQYRYADEEGHESHNGNVRVPAPPFLSLITPGSPGVGGGVAVTGVPVPGNATNFGNTSPQDVFIDVANQQHYVYFAYKVQDTFNVTFHENAGSDIVSNMPSTLTDVPSDSKISEPSPNPSRNGYEFVGWASDSNGDLMWIFNYDTIIQDTDLYAIWDIDQYNITYNNLQGAAHGNLLTFNVNDLPVTLSAPVVRDGWTFEGWYSDSGFTSSITSITTTGDKTVYAKWGGNGGNGPDEYTITYVDSVGGTIVDDGLSIQTPRFNVLSYNVTSSVTLYDLEKSGYTFNGWFDNAAFSGNPVTNFGPGEIGDKTFYAGWTKTGGNGGSGTGGAIVVDNTPEQEPESGMLPSEDSAPSKNESQTPTPAPIPVKQVMLFILLIMFALAIICGFARSWINIKGKN